MQPAETQQPREQAARGDERRAGNRARLAQKFSVQRCADDLQMNFRPEHHPAGKRCGMFVLQEVGRGADHDDLVTEKFAVLEIVPPDARHEDLVQRNRAIKGARRTGEAKPVRHVAGWDQIGPAKLSQRTRRQRFLHVALGEGHRFGGDCISNLGFRQPKARASNDVVHRVGPGIHEAHARILGERTALGSRQHRVRQCLGK